MSLQPAFVQSISIKGLRGQNEDKHNIILNIEGIKKDIANINFYSIYDGHGGKYVSKYLSETLYKYFLTKKTPYPLTKNYVYEVYNKIQNNLKKTNNANRTGSTGLVVINFRHNGENYLNILNTGDSRCVLCRDNIAIPLTKDHKPHWPEEKTRIELLNGKITFDGYDWRINDLSVSRAFGDVDSTPFLTHIPDIFRYKLDKNDKFFVLACDGLWDVMSNQDVVNFIINNSYDLKTNTRINKNTNIAKLLAEFALKKGSSDNISIIIVFIHY